MLQTSQDAVLPALTLLAWTLTYLQVLQAAILRQTGKQQQLCTSAAAVQMS
jgi:hypothetical protein